MDTESRMKSKDTLSTNEVLACLKQAGINCHRQHLNQRFGDKLVRAGKDSRSIAYTRESVEALISNWRKFGATLEELRACNELQEKRIAALEKKLQAIIRMARLP